MSLTAEQIEEWIGDHGPWLYWCTHAPLWPWILRDGIQPREPTGQGGLHADLRSRPGHVYLLTDWIPLGGLLGAPARQQHAGVGRYWCERGQRA